MSDVFRFRSLNVIDDFSISERRYFFRKVRELKDAIISGDEATLDSFRINDPDFGIYEVFLEDSTRTKESFRNAAEFHHAKVSELLSSSSSINKGESYADTFNMLSGYHNTIFIVRSKVEGLTKWLSEECGEYAERNNLPYKPAFINAGDGKHEHPTQELLDEFTFLEDLDMSFDSIHVALVGDLYHGRTVHSKADGLRIFDHVKVDLIAPEELMMPDSYIEKMKENGFEVTIYPSIDEYVKKGDIARLWYFTRPQLERMGERILQKQEILREAFRMLAPGGRLVYSTCTFEPEENQLQAEQFLSEHGELELLSQEQIFPHRVEGEGHYCAVFRREGEAPEGAPSLSEAAERLRRARIHILRCGVEPGELIKGKHKRETRYEPSHAEAMAMGQEELSEKSLNLLTEELSAMWLRGESLNLAALPEGSFRLLVPEDFSGYLPVCFDGYPLGFGKLVKGVVKNHYPKGLRRNYPPGSL